eukprot:2637949-Prymnesium_polylepis.2
MQVVVPRLCGPSAGRCRLTTAAQRVPSAPLERQGWTQRAPPVRRSVAKSLRADSVSLSQQTALFDQHRANWLPMPSRRQL